VYSENIGVKPERCGVYSEHCGVKPESPGVYSEHPGGYSESRGVKPEHSGGYSENHGEFSGNLREESRNEVTINKIKKESKKMIKETIFGLKECLRRAAVGRCTPDGTAVPNNDPLPVVAGINRRKKGKRIIMNADRLIENLYNRKPKATAMEQHVPQPGLPGLLKP
jgi:hypothetical protein